MVAKAPDGFPLGAFVLVDRLDEFRDNFDGRAHGERVVVEQGELRAPVAHFVRHIEWSAHERGQVRRSDSPRRSA